MGKVADVLLRWKKSPSADVKKVTLVLALDGTETTTDLGPEVEDFAVVVKANTGCVFTVITWDADGLAATSASYAFGLGDLELPLPATDLGHEIIGIRDVPDTPG